MAKINYDNPILILGAGTFGLSTAYHLAKAGYKNIIVLEKCAPVPPAQSAGDDLNKIIRAEYEDPFYTELALEAIKEWKTPLFAPYYHEVGYLLTTSPTAPEKSKKTLQKSLSSIIKHPAFKDSIIPINSRDDIRSVAPVFDGPMPWTGYFNKLAGYAHAADSLRAIYAACIALGVVVHLGDAVENLTFSGETCIGATTVSGKTYKAAVTIVALGASAATLIPSLGKQVTARGFPVAHVALTPEEAVKLRGIPVTYARDIGFFFEPDDRANLLKLCPAGEAYTNYDSSGKISVPPYDPTESDWIPGEAEDIIRRLLRETLPALADRPLVNKKICWCADTADTEYIIDFTPGKKNLVVLSGDSGHGFKMLPVFGKWVKDLLENGEQGIKRWRWKNHSGDNTGDISWRVGKSKDLKEFGPRTRL